jgi:predicted Zn-dependent peptidase
MYFRQFFSLDELVESIESVSARDVQAIARSFFNPGQIAVTVLGKLEKFKLEREDLAC